MSWTTTLTGKLAGAALAARMTRGETRPTSAVVTQEDFQVVVEATGRLEAAVAFAESLTVRRGVPEM